MEAGDRDWNFRAAAPKPFVRANRPDQHVGLEDTFEGDYGSLLDGIYKKQRGRDGVPDATRPAVL